MVVNTKEIDNENVYAGLVETYLVKNAFQEPKLEIKIIGEVLENKLNENRYEEVMKWLSEKDQFNIMRAILIPSIKNYYR